jgi:ABC-type sugar transport system permease subunit
MKFGRRYEFYRRLTKGVKVVAQLIAQIKKQLKKLWLTPYFFVAPFLIIIGIFMVYPFIEGIRLSFMEVSGFGGEEFVGFQNFRDVLRDEIFQKSLWHSLEYMAASFIIQIPIAFIMAVILNQAPLKLRGPLRTAFFVPVMISGTVTAVLFRNLLNKEFGAINWLMGVFHLPNSTGWLVEPAYAIPVIIFVGTWMWTGFHIVYLLSNLQTIPAAIYEVARIDGASWWRLMVSVILPLMRPALTFSIITSAIGSLQLFDLPFLMFASGDTTMNYAPSTLMTYVYDYAFRRFHGGIATAAGWIIFIIVMIVTLIQLKLLGFGNVETERQ